MTIIIDHTYYLDIDFKDWSYLDSVIPEKYRNDTMMDHPGAKTRFFMTQGFYFEFSHEKKKGTRKQGFSFCSEKDLFDLERSFDEPAREKYGFNVYHKNRDWQNHVDDNGEAIYFKKGDSRIEKGWQIFELNKSLIPRLTMWITKYEFPKYVPYSERDYAKTGSREFSVTEVHVSKELYQDKLFSKLSQSDSLTKVLVSENTSNPIDKIIVGCTEEMYEQVKIEEKDGIKSYKGSSEYAYNIVFRKEF